MKLAVNFSQALLGLLNENPELPVEYIKVPTIPFPEAFTQFDQGSKYRKLIPHPAQVGVLCLGHPQPESRYNWEIIREIIARTDPPYLSTHLEARVEYFPDLQPYQHQDICFVRDAILDRMLGGINRVKQETGLPLVIENFPYYRWGKHFSIGSEPSFLREVCKKGNCGFLLDIAHARCSAYHLDRDLGQFILEFPLERLREIHLAGTQLREEGMRDTHTALEEDDYRVLQMVLERAKPEIISIEYGGMQDRIINIHQEYEYVWRNNPVELEEMINRVRDIINYYC